MLQEKKWHRIFLQLDEPYQKLLIQIATHGSEVVVGNQLMVMFVEVMVVRVMEVVVGMVLEMVDGSDGRDDGGGGK